MPCRIRLNPDTSYQSLPAFTMKTDGHIICHFFNYSTATMVTVGYWQFIWLHKMVHKSLFTPWPFERYGCGRIIMLIPTGVQPRGKRGTEYTEPLCDEGRINKRGFSVEGFMEKAYGYKIINYVLPRYWFQHSEPLVFINSAQLSSTSNLQIHFELQETEKKKREMQMLVWQIARWMMNYAKQAMHCERIMVDDGAVTNFTKAHSCLSLNPSKLKHVSQLFCSKPYYNNQHFGYLTFIWGVWSYFLSNSPALPWQTDVQWCCIYWHTVRSVLKHCKIAYRLRLSTLLLHKDL